MGALWWVTQSRVSVKEKTFQMSESEADTEGTVCV